MRGIPTHAARSSLLVIPQRSGGICISPRSRDGKGGSKFPATLRKNNRKRLPETGNLGHTAYRAPCRVNALTNPSCCGQVDSISSRVAVS